MASSGSEFSEGESFELDFIVDSRKRGRNTEYLVRWKGYGKEEDSWEPARNVRQSKDALEKFNLKETTLGDRKRVNESEEITTSSSVSGGRNVTKKTVVTKSETRTISRRGGNQQVSEFSSPESSPILSRRGFLSGDLLKQDASSSNRQQRSTITSFTTSSSSSSNRPQLASGAARSTFGRGILKPAPCDWPIIIMVTCYLFIALTFVIQQK